MSPWSTGSCSSSAIERSRANVQLIQRMRIWKELKRLEQRVREEPSPPSFVDLAQVHINLGECDKAVEVAQEGMALFPQSVELQQLRRFAHRSLLRNRIHELRERIAFGPNERLYNELAMILLELGDFPEARQVCEDCLHRFPEDLSARLSLAQAQLGNYYRDLAAGEGAEAVRSLSHILTREPENRQARRLLAELLCRLGAAHAARPHLERLKAAGEDISELELMVGHAGGDGAPEDIDRLLEAIEAGESALFQPRPRRRQVSGEDGLVQIRDALARLVEAGNVSKAAYIRGSKAIARGAIRDGKDPFLRIVRSLAKSGQRFARRLDIGNFSKAVLEGPFGTICICSYGEVVAALQCNAGSDVDDLLGHLQELVASTLLQGGGSQ